MSSFCEIQKLVELFNVNSIDQENQEDEETDTANTVRFSSNEKPKENEDNLTKPKRANPYAKLDPPERKEVLDPEANEDDLYFEDKQFQPSQSDWKETPSWDISYRQSVSASDVFLGMGFKNASTASCENMVVSINLPKESRQNIDLKIEKETLTLESAKFYLHLKLPHPVDPKRGSAQFDKEAEKLIVTLRMDRELDLVNF